MAEWIGLSDEEYRHHLRTADDKAARSGSVYWSFWQEIEAALKAKNTAPADDFTAHPPSRHCMCDECKPSFDDNARPPVAPHESNANPVVHQKDGDVSNKAVRPICNLWVDPENSDYIVVDRCNHPTNELIPVVPADQLRAVIAERDQYKADAERLREALKFYAEQNHFVIADEDAWDTVSGESQNYWCDSGTATVEDGWIAREALAAKGKA